jgi:hypothetical protein
MITDVHVNVSHVKKFGVTLIKKFGVTLIKKTDLKIKFYLVHLYNIIYKKPK